MGTAHGTEELGLCSHGLAYCPGRPLGPLHRGLLRIWPYLDKIKSDPAGKNILPGRGSNSAVQIQIQFQFQFDWHIKLVYFFEERVRAAS
jgi:hypothetical protein